ncbi:hypothetical protein C0Q70_00662 [Pomacea canaliculata]|uniref:Uncharacterized protein n=1 Tax=Pomacea canaliculata TaxID=400727 RepID=A0A2T7PXA2_POMCA|nr:hypothetical protein C0Q70_00662 [Pomacea canaliculata]
MHIFDNTYPLLVVAIKRSGSYPNPNLRTALLCKAGEGNRERRFPYLPLSSFNSLSSHDRELGSDSREARKQWHTGV